MLKIILTMFSFLYLCHAYGDIQMTDQLQQQLLDQAVEARTHAYVPYSNEPVGVALLTSKGIIYRGTNLEKASCGVVCCAEHAAVAKAISEGEKEFVAMAIVAKGGLC